MNQVFVKYIYFFLEYYFFCIHNFLEIKDDEMLWYWLFHSRDSTTDEEDKRKIWKLLLKSNKNLCMLTTFYF